LGSRQGQKPTENLLLSGTRKTEGRRFKGNAKNGGSMTKGISNGKKERPGLSSCGEKEDKRGGGRRINCPGKRSLGLEGSDAAGIEKLRCL